MCQKRRINFFFFFKKEEEGKILMEISAQLKYLIVADFYRLKKNPHSLKWPNELCLERAKRSEHRKVEMQGGLNILRVASEARRI